MEEPTQEPTEIPQVPKKGRGKSREYLAEISKKGNEVKKMMGTINAYEKAKKKKEIEDKFAMIQAEIAKTKLKQESPPENTTPEPSVPEPPQQQQQPQKRPPPKKKKIVEVIEEVEEDDDEDDEEEEVIVKRIIKKKTAKPKKEIDVKDEFIKQTNLEMLKNRFNEDIKRRIASSLFDD